MIKNLIGKPIRQWYEVCGICRRVVRVDITKLPGSKTTGRDRNKLGEKTKPLLLVT